MPASVTIRPARATERPWTLDHLALLEHAPDAMLAVDARGRIVFASSRSEALFGYAPRELLGQAVELLVPGAMREHHRDARHRYAHAPHARPMGHGLELSGLRKDGTQIPLDISLSPIHLVDGGPVVIAAVRDITERKTAERQLHNAHRRLHRDLEAAAAIQKSLFPKAMPSVNGIRFAWALEASERLAGDSFNVFSVDADHVAFYLLDVSGHGVAAALQAVALTRVLASRPWPSSVLQQILSPADVAIELNRQFPIDPDTWQYFTFLCGTLNVKTWELRFTSAGHPGPIHLPARAEPVVFDAPGFPIGLFPDATYEEHRLLLEPGDRVLFHSDGATDATDASGDDFGRRRLTETWDACRGIGLQDAVASVAGTIKRWSGGAGLQDDLTLLVVEASAGNSTGAA